MPPASQLRASKFSIIALLSVVAIVELILYRILYPLLRSEVELLPVGVFHGVVIGAVFAQHLAAVLAQLTLMAAVPLLLWRGVIVNRGAARFAILGPARGARVLLVLLFLPLCVLLVVGPEGGARLVPALGKTRAYLYMLASFVTLAALVALSLLPRRLALAERLAGLLLLPPLALRVFAYLSLAHGEEPLALLLLADAAAGLIWLVVPLLLAVTTAPASRRRGLPLLAALCGAGALALLLRADWEITQRIFYSGFGLRLPTARLGQAGAVLALGSYVYGVVSLLQRRGALSLYGYGFLLGGLAGFQLQEGYQMALWLCGFLCLARAGAERESSQI